MGHRKIWAMMRVRRALRRRGLLQPARYQAERRQLARARRETFVSAPRCRNVIWRADFTEFETSSSGTWRMMPVVDYATKLCFTVPISGTQAARDDRRDACGGRGGRGDPRHPLEADCIDSTTGEFHPLTIVTDNGPAYRATDFAGFFRARPWLTHVRTRHRARRDQRSRRAVQTRA
jgi:hypothetical protein